MSVGHGGYQVVVWLTIISKQAIFAKGIYDPNYVAHNERCSQKTSDISSVIETMHRRDF